MEVIDIDGQRIIQEKTEGMRDNERGFNGWSREAVKCEEGCVQDDSDIEGDSKVSSSKKPCLLLTCSFQLCEAWLVVSAAVTNFKSIDSK